MLFRRNANMSDYVSLRVYYKDKTCAQYKRTVVFTWDATLAAFGGIFGLCTGGSIISIIEVAFYFVFHYFVIGFAQKSTTTTTTTAVRKMKRRSKVAEQKFAMEYGRRLQQFRCVTTVK